MGLPFGSLPPHPKAPETEDAERLIAGMSAPPVIPVRPAPVIPINGDGVGGHGFFEWGRR